jgi:hypothetical protein
LFNFRRSLFLSGIAACIASSAYTQSPGDLIAPPGPPDYASAGPVDSSHVDPSAPASTFVFQLPAGATDTSSVLQNSTLGRSGNANSNKHHSQNTGGNILGLNSVTTFGGAFAGQAGTSQGNVFKYSILGNPPAAGGTTQIPARIDEVSWTLLNANGTVFKTVSFSPFETLTLNSPNFQAAKYSSSSSPVQFADAVQRASFYNSLQPGQPWHTELAPSVVNKVNITVPYIVNVQLSNGNVVQARSYFTGTAADGSTFVLMLNLLFNFLFDNEVVNEINLNNFTTDAINITAFPNTFLFSLNTSNPSVPGGCCTLGYHTYFYEPGSVPQNRWLSVFESWISPGLFGNGFQDVTALSHEVSETFNNPFLDNAAPNWQFPGQPHGSTVCQNNLETGDPIEVLPNATLPITLGGYTYHPQNEALVPWFGMGSSNAINGAYSYPDTAVLPHAALPCGS